MADRSEKQVSSEGTIPQSKYSPRGFGRNIREIMHQQTLLLELSRENYYEKHIVNK
jgi:hypothetical protein